MEFFSCCRKRGHEVSDAGREKNLSGEDPILNRTFFPLFHGE
jgi:hypothetical protein